jgi:hypothetical protein
MKNKYYQVTFYDRDYNFDTDRKALVELKDGVAFISSSYAGKSSCFQADWEEVLKGHAVGQEQEIPDSRSLVITEIKEISSLPKRKPRSSQTNRTLELTKLRAQVKELKAELKLQAKRFKESNGIASILINRLDSLLECVELDGEEEELGELINKWFNK